MGQPKACLPFGEETMLQRIVRIVGAVCEETIVVAAAGQECPSLPSTVTLVHDRVAGQGPLEGLDTGLAALSSNPEFLYATAADTPFLVPEWIARLRELIGPHDAAIPEVDDKLHPLAALYRTTPLIHEVNSLRRDNQRRLMLLATHLRTRFVTPDELRIVDPPLQSLRNINFPEDYERALRDL
ncbi:molybdenum cofactor guanylyltransferase [Singulisphaera sp. PoT]|uniref:molybdenum cofactor guanylyltransferase n=1 Tax=Singulisphaera sp. PoT TaxID=3411797 RepID=UPI003BF523A4